MAIFEILLGLLAACVGLALVARRLDVPLAVVLVVGGMALAFTPGLPTVTLDPQLALVLFLPPLLQASAYRTDWLAFRFNLRPILFLALGAVLFTAAAVAVTVKALVPDLPWAAAIALGAIVAPPDAVAAASVLRNFPHSQAARRDPGGREPAQRRLIPPPLPLRRGRHAGRRGLAG